MGKTLRTTLRISIRNENWRPYFKGYDMRG
jgi:hypothetical protein